MKDELLTITEALELIPRNITRQTFYKVLSDGTGPPYLRIGSRKFIYRSHIMKWLTPDVQGGGKAGEQQQ